MIAGDDTFLFKMMFHGLPSHYPADMSQDVVVNLIQLDYEDKIIKTLKTKKVFEAPLNNNPPWKGKEEMLKRYA